MEEEEIMDDLRSEMCRTCIHTNVCRHDKNLVGDKFVMGNPLFFDNRKLFEKYEKWEREGFPCDDYISAEVIEVGKWYERDDLYGIEVQRNNGMEWWRIVIKEKQTE